jgi:hypothetical protein
MTPELTDIQKITVHNVRTAARFPKLPANLSPELEKPVRLIKKLRILSWVITPRRIVEMVETEVELNSNPY